MQQFSVFLIQKNYAEHFYYKIDILFRFLKEQLTKNHQQNLNQLEEVLNKIDIFDLLFHFQHHLNDYQFEENKIIIKNSLDEVIIQINDYCLNVQADSILIADQLFFRYIKSFNPHLFVINFETNDCGWISPLENRELYRL